MTTAIAQALSSALLHFVWQGLVSAFLLRAVLFGLRNRSANSRYLVSCVALAALLAMPVVTAFVLYRAPAAVGVATTAAPAPPPASILATGTPSPWHWISGWQSWIVPAWSLGVLLCSLRLIWACRQVSALRRQGTPAHDSVLAIVSRLEERLDLTRRVRVLITSAADGPSVVGWLRPVILLPAATMLGLTAEQLEAVLAHELAHVRRHDYLVNIVQTVVESLLFYHPAVWWISARIRHERELCCDDLAVLTCGDAMCYARALTRLEKLRAAPALAMAGTGGSLLYRIQRLVGARTSEYAPSRLSGILAIVLGVACFAMNVHWARGQSQEPKGERNLYVYTRMEGPDAPGIAVDLNGASVRHRSSIEYPHVALEKGVQGAVTVEAILEADGSVADARVLSGPSELRRVVLQSVLEWHFVAGTSGASRQVTVTFDPAAARKRQAEERVEIRTVEGPIGFARTVNLAPERPDRDEELQRQIREIEEKLLEQRLSQRTESDATRSLEAQLEEARATFENLSREREMASPARAVGHRLAQIDATGFPDEIRRALLARIPVRIGDTLTQAAIERIAVSVATFDQHESYRPAWNLVPLDSGDFALQIVAPESELRK